MKSFLFFVYSKYVVKKEYQSHKNYSEIQNNFLLKQLKDNKNTEYGKKYGFQSIRSIEDYKNQVPLIQYEDILSDIERIKNGEKSILSSAEIRYLLQTSGTSSGSKFIPISKSGIKNQINAALKLMCFYAIEKGHAKFMNGKMLFLQGSPELNHSLPIPYGRLSGIVYHHVPKIFQKNKLPSYETNIIENWQEKINKIVGECMGQDITIFGGIPPWCLQFFELICKKTNHPNLKSTFPNLSLYIYGGVDFTSYKSSLQKTLGEQVDMMQTFPASEGFFGIQDKIDSEDMLLLIHQGVFYEFIDMKNIENKHAKPILLCDVELNKNYELVITNDSGLWRYRMGDLIQFTSKTPYRIKVTGRTSQFISAFGEHVIGYEIEHTMNEAIKKFDLNIEDYHVSPNVDEKRYEWRIEWKKEVTNIPEIELYFDTQLSAMNKYYRDLIDGKIIDSCKIISLSMNSFANLRKKLGKEGGQNKVVRLGNNDNFSKWLDQTIFFGIIVWLQHIDIMIIFNTI